MIKTGEWNELKVIRSKDFGIYLGEEGSSTGETVLLPRKQVPEGVKAGATMTVFIYRDSQDRPIATVHEPLITMGTMARLKVKSATQIGAFMDWGLEKDIFLPFKEQTTQVKEGHEYLVRMYEDKSGRLCVSMRLYNFLKPMEGYKKGDSFNGIVYEYKKGLGAFVAVEDKYSGLIHESEMGSPLYPGDLVSGRVVQVRPDGKADLSLREVAYKQMEDDADMVYRVIESYGGVLPFNDKADKDLIQKEFGLSKNAFKRAVGRLLKEGRVTIGENDITITDK
ncbi:MAG: RNA-binding protein [Lachnospiraceae bacterium]|nr:RNA-binding protein [Lachnospiraceae bacterium]